MDKIKQLLNINKTQEKSNENGDNYKQELISQVKEIV